MLTTVFHIILETSPLKKKKSFTFHRAYKQRCFSKNYQNFLEKKFINK